MSSPASDRAMTNDAKKKEGDARVYTHPVTGEEWRSVTTILNAASKPALNNWIVKTVANFAADNLETLAQMDRDAAADLVRSSRYSSSKDSSDLGNQVHKRIEDLANGVVPPFVKTPEGLEFVDKMWEELNQEFEIRLIAAEATLINRTIGYAGSGDLIVWIRRRENTTPNGMHDPNPAPWRRAVIDAKSGKSIYGSVSLQLVAYAKAEHILHPDGTEEPMPVIHETYSLHVRPRSWSLIPMRYDLLTWQVFQALVTVDQWITYHERGAVGRAVNAGAIGRMRK